MPKQPFYLFPRDTRLERTLPYFVVLQVLFCHHKNQKKSINKFFASSVSIKHELFFTISSQCSWFDGPIYVLYTFCNVKY